MIGKPLGHYEVVEALGAGGMGEVYRARDANLKRDVAIKVLPEDLADDPERLARLEREAHLLAALNHSNIATIYSLEESEGTRFLVMELVKGQSLEELLAEGPLPVDEALDICRQIAEALEAAHEEGIIHRDLKPANVLVTPDGKAKVLDFGLAKTVEHATSDTDLSRSPTITIAATEAGVILGTAPYMSPEQVRGKRLDKRADIWAFGCVLYEALTGHRAFSRETVADTLAAILEVEPPWDALAKSTPPVVRSLLLRCLRKDPKRRLRDVGDARIELEEALGVAPVTTQEMAARSAAGADRGVPWKIAAPVGIVVALAAVLVAWFALRPVPAPPEHWEYSLPNGVEFELSSEFAMSPDGSRIVFTYNLYDQLWVREVGDPEWRPIPHTEGADSPVFSPDGEQIAFAGDGKIRRIGFTGGAPSVVAEVTGEGLSWGEDDNIYFGKRSGDAIWRVPAAGGEPEPIIALRESEWAFGPHLLPGGEWVLFNVNHVHGWYWKDAEVVAESLITKERKSLMQGTQGRYVSTGHVLAVRDSALFVAPFELDRIEAGVPLRVVDGVQHWVRSGRADYAVSSNGRLAFRPGSYYADERPLGWFDRNGGFEPLPFEPLWYYTPRPSPDGRYIATAAYAPGTDNPTDMYIYIYEVDTGLSSRLTNEGRAALPTWSPDGRYLYFTWNKNDTLDIWKAPVDRSADAEFVWGDERNNALWSISRDGSQLFGWTYGGPEPMPCWRLLLDRDPVQYEPLTSPESNCNMPDVSPDGKYFVHQTDDDGEWKVWVKEAMLQGRQWTISEGRAQRPRWSADGEIFYRSLESRNPTSLYAVEVTTEPEFSHEPPHKLFDWYNEGDNSFTVSADGDRFLMIGPIEKPASHLRIITNWFEELRARVPAGR